MKQFFTKVYSLLRSTKLTDQIIKIGVEIVLLVAGFFFEPFVIAATAALVVFIAFEFDFKSFYYIVFFYLFTAGFRYGTLDLFYIPSVFFMGLHLVKYFMKVKFGFYKDWVFVSFFAFFLYMLLAQLIGRADFARVTMAAHLMFLLFVCIKNLDKLQLERIAFFLAGGIFVSSCFGLLRNIIPKLSRVIGDFNGRFSALMLNPNSFYTLVLGAIAVLFVLNIQNRMNKYLFWGAFAALTVIGLSTLSRGFLVIYVPLVIVFAVIKLLKVRNEKGNLRRILLFVVPITAVFILVYFTPQFKAVFDRLMVLFDTFDSQLFYTDDPGRWGLWKLYVETWAGSVKSIIFGIGFAPPLSPHGIPVISAHNMFIVILTQTGIIGFALFGLLIFCVFRSICKTRNFKLECCLPMLGAIGFCMVETSLFRFQVYLFIVMILLCMPVKKQVSDAAGTPAENRQTELPATPVN